MATFQEKLRKQFYKIIDRSKPLWVFPEETLTVNLDCKVCGGTFYLTVPVHEYKIFACPHCEADHYAVFTLKKEDRESKEARCMCCEYSWPTVIKRGQTKVTCPNCFTRLETVYVLEDEE